MAEVWHVPSRGFSFLVGDPFSGVFVVFVVRISTKEWIDSLFGYVAEV